MKKEFTQTLKILLTAVVLSLGISYAYAWTAPTLAPPDGNTSAPLNTGSSDQIKTGGLEIDSTLKTSDDIVASGTYGSGTAISTPGAGTRMMWNPRKSAFRAGTVIGTEWDDLNVGGYSTAMGRRTIASGDNSTAMGFLAIAGGNYSTAIGSQVSAGGDYSIATNYNTTADGDYSVAMGRSTTASERYSTAMGYNTTASGVYSTALGLSTIASNYRATAMGYLTGASGNTATAMGYGTDASGAYSTAMGYSTLARGVASTAIGRGSDAGGETSIAMGYFTGASGVYSTAIGRYVNASGAGSIIIGRGYTNPSRLTNSTPDSFAVGYMTSPIDTTPEFIVSDGNVTVNGVFTNASDQRLKENISKLSSSNINKILKLNGVSFNWKEGKKKDIGFIAQDVEKVYPELVYTNKETGMKSVQYTSLIVPLVEVAKDQQKQIGKQDRQIKYLMEEIEKLKNR